LPLAVDLRGVHKSFGTVKAVRGIDLAVHSGEVIAFLGPNGAGKTSTIDMILGLSRPTDGEVEVFGMAPREAISRGLVSAVMQSGGLLKDLNVGETLRYTSKLFASSRPVGEVLARAGIAEIEDRMVGKCSGGEQQRLRFAMALLPDPELLILDEPTQGMDVEGRREFWKAITEDAAKGRTILFATHYLEEADAYAGRIVLIRTGEIVADGTAAEVKSLAAGRTKMLTSLVLGLAAVLAVYIVGAITGKPSMPVHVWIITALCLWIGSLLFAAFGLFIGYLLPSENVMQIIGFALMLFAFGGGVFIPLSQFSSTLQNLAQYTPLYGLSQLVHYPLTGGSLHPTWVVNLIVWLMIFVGGAAWRFRRDTARV